MDLQAEKLDRIRAILNIEDAGTLIDIKNLIASWDHDWFDELTEEQQQTVDTAKEELDRGEGIPHEEAIKILGLDKIP